MVVMVMKWPEATKAQYEAVRASIDWVSHPPKGGLLHVAGWDESGMRVVDLWDSAEEFQAFVANTLGAAAAAAGLTTQPHVEFFPVSYIDQLGIKQLR